MANTYEAFFRHKRATLTADSLADAKDKAVEHFKPHRTQQHMVSVVLAKVGDRVIPINESNADFG